MRWIFYFTLQASAFALANAVNCWVCSDAVGDAECHKNGDLVSCAQGQVCQNEVRVIRSRMRVTKRCKQEAACMNNKMQNKIGVSLTQCNTSKKKYVCRCCCDTDECNTNALFCVEGFAESPDETPRPEGQERLFTESEATTLRESWHILESIGNRELGMLILHRLFNDLPIIRPMFPQLDFPEAEEIDLEYMRESPQISAFANSVAIAIATVVDLLEMPDQLIDYVTTLGEEGPLRIAFDHMGAALLATIQENLEIEKDSDILRTWAKAYGIIKDTISKTVPDKSS